MGMAHRLIGIPKQVCAKVAAFAEAGLDGFYAHYWEVRRDEV
jgi:hypothetical protein